MEIKNIHKLFLSLDEDDRNSLISRYYKVLSGFIRASRRSDPCIYKIIRAYLGEYDESCYDVLNSFIGNNLVREFKCTTNTAIIESIDHMVCEGYAENISV